MGYLVIHVAGEILIEPALSTPTGSHTIRRRQIEGTGKRVNAIDSRASSSVALMT